MDRAITHLPRHTRERCIHQEARIWEVRLANRQRNTAGAVELAKAELTWSASTVDAWEFQQRCEGRHQRCTVQLDLSTELADHRDQQWRDADALLDLLRQHLTRLELEAIQQRADGVAVRDRHCLARARRKAQAALQEVG